MTRTRNLDLNLFLVFDALMRSASVSKAARSLGVSQSAVSHSLRKLRVHFGDQLFLKTRDGVAPTEKALAVAPDVQRFVDFAQAALVGPGMFDPAVSSRVITLSMSDMAEMTFVPALLERLEARAPGCRLRVLEAWGEELKTGLEQGRIDLAITGRNKPEGDVLQQKLFEHAFSVVVDASSDLEGEIDLDTFSRRTHVVVAPTWSMSTSLETMLARQGVRRNAPYTTSHWLIVPHVLKRRPHYVAVVPRQLAQAHQPYGLRSLKPTFELPRITVLQFWHRRANSDTFNIWLRSLMKDVMAGLAPSLND